MPTTGRRDLQFAMRDQSRNWIISSESLVFLTFLPHSDMLEILNFALAQLDPAGKDGR